MMRRVICNSNVGSHSPLKGGFTQGSTFYLKQVKYTSATIKDINTSAHM